MALELSPLQQHCLNSIGVQPWQLRKADSQTTSNSLTVQESKPVYQTSSDKQESPALNLELQRAINYVIEHSENVQLINWIINKESNDISLSNNELTLPTLTAVLKSSALKKQLWAAMSNMQS